MKTIDQANSGRREAAHQLMFISGYVHRLLRNEARRLGLRWMSCIVLNDLQLLGPSKQRQLAGVEQVSAPTMTVLIQQMERQGLVQRERGRDDARVSLVSITPNGRKELKRAGRLLRRRLEIELEKLSVSVLTGLEKNLGVLSAAVMKKIHGGVDGEGED
ncbi:MAG: MarR family winged helix-turn-helix transcriptional regulator [Opitutaceae bacterium]